MTDLKKRFANRERSPFLDVLDIQVRVEEGQPVVRVDIDEKHLRSHQIAHGGLLCTMLDMAMGTAAYAALDDAEPESVEASGEEPTETELVTSQLTIHFLRPAWNGESLIGRGEVLHFGSKTIVVRGDVETDGGKPVASGSGTFMRVSIPPTADNR